MSMCLGLTTVSNRNIQKIVESPALVWRLLAPDDPEIYFDGLRPERSIGFLSRLFGRRQATETPPLPDMGLAEGEGRSEDLDKAWHALHYFFTDSDWEGDPPLNFLVIGGTEVSGIDVGYGPPRVFSSSEVAEIDRALADIDDVVLRTRYDVEDMVAKDIYPTIWHREDEMEENFEYCLDYFRVLKSFLAKAAERRLGMLVSMQ